MSTPNYSPQELMLLIESKLAEGLSVSELFVLLVNNNRTALSFTGKPWTISTLSLAIRSFKDVNFRPKSVAALVKKASLVQQ
jgi:hypothetical protein